MTDTNQHELDGQHRTRVKICGITRQCDVDTAIRAGADALGFVFYPPSPRALSIEQAAQLCDGLPPFVTKVGLFVNASVEEVNAVLDSVSLSLLQFHGDESAEFCQQFSMPYIKAVRMAVSAADLSQGKANNTLDLLAQMDSHPLALGFLLDTYQPGVPGGTGHAFDWSSIPLQPIQPLILAGGLGSHNIADAINRVRPFAVDISSGVESSPGIKDADKIINFMREVNRG